MQNLKNCQFLYVENALGGHFDGGHFEIPSTSKALFQEVLTDLPPVFAYIKAFLPISLV
jgi:hypothetical protein